MYKECKCVKISYETKCWINELISHKEHMLKQEREVLIRKYEDSLKQQADFLHGYSPTLLFSVSHSSIIEAAYHYAVNTSLNWTQKQTEMECVINEMSYEEKRNVGTLTPQLRLRQATWDGLEKYRDNLQIVGQTNKTALNYIIQLIIFIYYQEIFNLN